jgi:hypothetical protein
MIVMVGWFKIAVRTLGCIAVCRGLWPRRSGKLEGFGGLLSGSGPTTGLNPLQWKGKGGDW